MAGSILHPPPAVFYWLGLAFFACALLSKPMVVTLPFVLLLLDMWPLGRMRNDEGGMMDAGETSGSSAAPVPTHASRFTHRVLRLLLEKLPFFVLAGASCVMTLQVQNASGAVASLSYMSFGQRLANAAVAYLAYLRYAVWPSGLAVFYPHPGSWPAGWVILSIALLGLISGAVLWQATRRPWLAVGWFWYVGTLVPAIGLVQVGNQAYADRYTYVPLIGVFILFAWGLNEVVAARSERLPVAVGIAVAVLLACGVATRQQLRHWENSEALFRHALAVTRNNYLAHHNLAFELASENRLDEARFHYERALAILPTYQEAHLHLGILLLKQGLAGPAREHLAMAVKIRPDCVEGYYNLGVASGMQGRHEEAVANLGRALSLQPDHLNAHYNLGLALATLGNLNDAERHYREAIRLGEQEHLGSDPRLALPHFQLGLLLLRQQRLVDARDELEHAARLAPNFQPAEAQLTDLRNRLKAGDGAATRPPGAVTK